MQKTFAELLDNTHTVIFMAQDENVLNLLLYLEVTESFRLEEPFQLRSTAIFFRDTLSFENLTSGN